MTTTQTASINFPMWVKTSECETRTKTELIPTEHGMIKNTVSNKIQYGTGWNCCKERPAKVVVFSNGARWAVCKSCASSYTGEVQELPTNG